MDLGHAPLLPMLLGHFLRLSVVFGYVRGLEIVLAGGPWTAHGFGRSSQDCQWY